MRAGTDLKEYKPTEPERLAEVFDGILAASSSGLEFLTELVHRLVWFQCLGNANHRTAILFIQVFLTRSGIAFPTFADEADAERRFREAVNRFSDGSHRLLDRQSEFGFNPARLEKEHRTQTRIWLAEMLGNQSRVETMVGPQRLMTFISSSES